MLHSKFWSLKLTLLNSVTNSGVPHRLGELHEHKELFKKEFASRNW